MGSFTFEAEGIGNPTRKQGPRKNPRQRVGLLFTGSAQLVDLINPARSTKSIGNYFAWSSQLVIKEFGNHTHSLKHAYSRMTSDSPEKETTTIVEMIERRRSLKPIWEYDWRNESASQMPRTPMVISWCGIVFAMGCYPIVLGALIAAFSFFAHGIQFELEMIFGAILFAIFSFLVGATYGMIMTIPAYLLLQVIGWISGGAISGRGASGIFGGLTGFLVSTGGGLFIAGLPEYDWRVITFMGTAALLAIAMGYLGAIGAGYRYRLDGFPFYDSLFTADKQFSIWFLLKLTTLVAVFSVICKAAGPAGLCLGIAWAAYAVFQTLLLLCDHGFGYWRGWRKSNPQ